MSIGCSNHSYAIVVKYSSTCIYYSYGLFLANNSSITELAITIISPTLNA